MLCVDVVAECDRYVGERWERGVCTGRRGVREGSEEWSVTSLSQSVVEVGGVCGEVRVIELDHEAQTCPKHPLHRDVT